MLKFRYFKISHDIQFYCTDFSEFFSPLIVKIFHKALYWLLFFFNNKAFVRGDNII